MKRGERFQAGSKLVDGLTIDDASTLVRDRIHLAEDGIIVALLVISRDSGDIVQGPDFITRGTTFTEENIAELKSLVIKSITTSKEKALGDTIEMRAVIRKIIKKYAFKTIKHSPMIIPIITEI